MAQTSDAGVVQEQAPAKPDYYLTVVHPFAHYQRGDLIKGPDEIALIQSGENAHHCHKVAAQ